MRGLIGLRALTILLGVASHPVHAQDVQRGLVRDVDGWVVDTSRLAFGNVWIANTAEGSISRFEVRTRRELARYFTGPFGAENDPSRTTVDAYGDAYVANRGSPSVVRVDAVCADRDGDGITRTSRGELLRFGEDECVRWYTDLREVLPGETHLRAIAVQEGRSDDPLARALWLGGYDTKRMVELDPETGGVRRVVQAPVRPYGFAIDRVGRIWIATREGARLGYLDPSRCLAESSCACGANREDIACAFFDAPVVPYGIAVDARGRVWVGGEDLARYDPSAPIGARWARADLPFAPGVVVHGLAVDASGRAWAGGLARGVLTAGENLRDWAIVPGTEGYSNKGIAIDDDGAVWSVTLGPRVLVITPGPTPLEARVETEVGRSLVGPYTYADMTGAQLRLATGPRGAWSHRATSCAEAWWGPPVVDADVPAQARVVIRARVSTDEGALVTAPWVTWTEGRAVSELVGRGAVVEPPSPPARGSARVCGASR